MIEIKKVLIAVFLKIHILFDLWTLLNRYTFYRIIVHFIGQGHYARSLLLSLKRMIEGHSGDNIVKIILNVLK
jgi:hypothetical protein